MEDLKLIVEIYEGVYIKNGKSDTRDLEEAKRFKSLKHLRVFVSNYGIRVRKIIQDCGNSIYVTYDR